MLLKGPGVIQGYWNRKGKTGNIRGSWLKSGDLGEIDGEGHVYILDRLKDVIITAGGKNITPSEIENQLKFSTFISDAVVIGDKKKNTYPADYDRSRKRDKFAQIMKFLHKLYSLAAMRFWT